LHINLRFIIKITVHAHVISHSIFNNILQWLNLYVEMNYWAQIMRWFMCLRCIKCLGLFRRIMLLNLSCWQTNQPKTNLVTYFTQTLDSHVHAYSGIIFVSGRQHLRLHLRQLIHLRGIICAWYKFNHWVYIISFQLSLTTLVHDFLDMSCMANKQQLTEFDS